MNLGIFAQSVQAAITHHQRLGDLSNINLFSPSPGGQKSRMKMLGRIGKKESKMEVAKRQREEKVRKKMTKENSRTGVRISGETNSPRG